MDVNEIKALEEENALKEKVKMFINAAFYGTNESCLGPMFRYPDPQDITQKDVNQIAFGAFSIAFTGLMRTIGGDNGNNNSKAKV